MRSDYLPRSGRCPITLAWHLTSCPRQGQGIGSELRNLSFPTVTSPRPLLKNVFKYRGWFGIASSASEAPLFMSENGPPAAQAVVGRGRIREESRWEGNNKKKKGQGSTELIFPCSQCVSKSGHSPLLRPYLHDGAKRLVTASKSQSFSKSMMRRSTSSARLNICKPKL